MQGATAEHASTPFGRVAYVARRVADLPRGWPRAEYQADPVRFAREVLGIEPWSRQVEILEAVRDHKRVAVSSGHKVGKSTTGAIVALWFFCSFPDARVVMTCVTARQIDDILFREVKKLHAAARRRGTPIDGEVHELARSGIKSSDFREITGYTAKEAEAVAGVSGPNLLYILDEASGIPQPIYEAVEGNRAGGARVFLTSNPTRCEGEFFDAFETKAKFYTTFRISSEESPNVVAGREIYPGMATREWIEEKREEWGEESMLFKVRVKGEHVKQEEGKIISLHLLGEAEVRHSSTPATGRLQLGVDPAGPGEGGDETAFSATRGQRQLAIFVQRALTEDAIVVHLLDFMRVHRAPGEKPIVCIDRDGPIGSKVYGLLRAYRDAHPDDFELFGIRSSDKAPRNPQIYGTVRDELWANGAEWLREGGALLEDTKQTKDLHSASWVPIASYGINASRLKATDKKDIRKAIGRSPDRGDAFLLSVWMPSALTRETVQSTRSRDHEPELVAVPERDAGSVFDPYGGAG